MRGATGSRSTSRCGTRRREGAVKDEPVPFATTGGGPHRSLTQASPLKLVGLTDFVSVRGVGGDPRVCDSPSVCAVTTVVSVGRTVIARPGAN